MGNVIDSSSRDNLCRWKSRKEELDEGIVECAYDLEHVSGLQWRFMRIRDDKEHANHETTVNRVMESIRDGVDADQVLLNLFHSQSLFY